MIRSKMTFALAVFAVAITCVAAQAATLTMSVAYNQSYMPPGLSTCSVDRWVLKLHPLRIAGRSICSGAIHQFDVFMTLTDTLAGEDFQTAVFDCAARSGRDAESPPLAVPGSGANPLYDPAANTGNGALTLPFVFTNNADAGVANDLKGITVIANATSNHAGTHARHPGENEPNGADPDNTNLTPPYVSRFRLRQLGRYVRQPELRGSQRSGTTWPIRGRR